MKESVRIQWIKTTCVCLRWRHRNAAHTCEEQWRHLHPPGAPHACFQNLFLLPTFCCSQRKLLACRLHCGLHLVRLVKQINKYSLLLHGHLPPWPVSRTILWKALPWQEAPWRNLCGQRSHGKKAAGKADAQDAPEGLVLRSTVCLPRSECFLLQIFLNEFYHYVLHVFIPSWKYIYRNWSYEELTLVLRFNWFLFCI